MAKYVIEKALRDGRLKPGDTIIDSTSGNTGVGVAMVAAAYNIQAVFTTSEKTSQEKVDLIKALGAEVIVTPATDDYHDPQSCYQTAIRIAREKGYFYLDQFHNPENIEAHYMTTAPEIWRQTEGRLTHIVAGIGTGGTLSGCGKYFKEHNPAVQVIAVDPVGSLFAEYIRSGDYRDAHSYLVEGIGGDMPCSTLDPTVIDDVFSVSDSDAFATARHLAKRDGVLAGGSSGAAAWAAFEVARTAGPDDVIVVIFPDSAIRYLTKCFSDRWMQEHGLLQMKKATV
jgi:cystathionine beta-synthase